MKDEELPDRHLECCECKKPIAVCYTEIIGKSIHRIGMCADCPLLRQKLHGLHSLGAGKAGQAAPLTCGGCGLTADDIRMGTALGCSLCYEVFEELIVQELVANGRIAQRVAGMKKGASLHAGRRPGQIETVNPAMKLLALHQALNETLSREDYEQAAWLRDQIKALTEKPKKENG